MNIDCKSGFENPLSLNSKELLTNFQGGGVLNITASEGNFFDYFFPFLFGRLTLNDELGIL